MEGARLSTWDRIQRLPEHFRQQIQLLYGDRIPIEVRKALSDWIDKQDWQLLNPDNPDVTQYIPVLFNQFLSELEDKAAKSGDVLSRHKLGQALTAFRQNFSADPTFLIHMLRNCIMSEQKLLLHCESSLNQGQPALRPDHGFSVMHEIEESRQHVHRLEGQIKQMKHLEDAFVLHYQELQKANSQLQQVQVIGQADMIVRAQQEVAQLEELIKERARELHQARLNFIEKFKESLQHLGHLVHQIINKDLANWHRAQQLAGNGQPVETNFEQIQDWCDTLTEQIWHHSLLIQKLQFLITKMPTASGASLKENLAVLESQIKRLLSVLVCGTFVIEKQPPQVMKTNTNFAASVRLLVGAKLNECFGKYSKPPPQVKASIISETQACVLARSEGYASSEASGEIQHNVGTMEHHQATRQLSVSFRNMSLKKIKRAEKKGTESVMDEKFCLLFQSIIEVADMTFSVQAQSLPVVVIVHGNQEPHAWATITWDNAFSEQKRMPFMIPESVPWQKIANVLSTKFRWATGRGLSESNLHFMATKAFRNSNLPHDYRDLMLSWSQFCKEPLPDRSFTFWEWFYAIMKVTREHLRPLWNDGLVWGFISRPEAEAMLLKKMNGTFLLRFSDSELGGVTIAWVSDTENNHKQILMVQPFTSKDFQIRSFADRISDLQSLVYLYPDTPRDQAFGKYYTPSVQQLLVQSTNGYIKPMLVTQIPGRQQQSLLDSNAPTPQSFYSHSESSNMYGGPHEGGFGVPNMQLYALSAQNANQPMKRLREEDICAMQQVASWQETAE